MVPTVQGTGEPYDDHLFTYYTHELEYTQWRSKQLELAQTRALPIARVQVVPNATTTVPTDRVPGLHSPLLLRDWWDTADLFELLVQQHPELSRDNQRSQVPYVAKRLLLRGENATSYYVMRQINPDKQDAFPELVLEVAVRGPRFIRFASYT